MAAIVRYHQFVTQIFPETYVDLVDEVVSPDVHHAPEASEWPRYSWPTPVGLLKSLARLHMLTGYVKPKSLDHFTTTYVLGRANFVEGRHFSS